MRHSLLLLLAFASAPALAQTSGPPAPAQGDTEPRHEFVPSDIVVTAPVRRNRADILSGVSVLNGAELDRQIRSTIGETVARLPGVSATSFGPNASRPILRGLGGDRVRVLTDGIGSFDVSNTSEDHVVAVNPQLAERIEVLRGPATLLYGSSAIGGVVNVIDSRIPRRVPAEGVHADLFGQYGSAAFERTFSGVVDLRVTSKLVVHFDGSYGKTDDLDIGGHVLSPIARATALASGNPEAQALANLKGTLPNTDSTTHTYAGGLAYIDPKFELGLVVSQFSTFYGVPIRYDLQTGEGEPVHLAAGQTRYDLRGLVRLDSGFLEQINLRGGYARYQHQEIGAGGEIGTTFSNNGGEGRIEFVQRKRGVWLGSFGAQFLARDFDAVGDEAFVPTNETLQGGIFTLQQIDLGRLKLEGGARYEQSNVRTTRPAFRDVADNRYDRSFDAVSASIGASYGLTDGIRIGLNLARTERAPSAEELLANGPHGGTQAFEIGDRNFATEKSLGAELTLRGNGRGWSFEGSAFFNRFDDFIYQQQTGAIDADSGFPIFQFRQAPARYWGLEAQARAKLARIGSMALSADAQADYVNAELLNGLGPVPRIPPFRFLGGADLSNHVWTLRAEIEAADRQDKISAIETVTPAYTLVNASAAWSPRWLRALNGQLVLAVNNIGNVEARRATSFLKDFAPIAGRDVRLSLRVVY